METERMSRKRALEIQDHPVSVSSYHPRKEVDGEFSLFLLLCSVWPVLV